MGKDQIFLSLVSGLFGAILVPMSQFVFKKVVNNINRKKIERFVDKNKGKASTFYINVGTNIHPDDIMKLCLTSKQQ